MGSRIITIQRQARELGRLRTGTFNGRYPERSNTWIVSSHAEHYVEAAAQIWGGTPEKWQPQGNGAAQFRVITQAVSLDAILPPGDPLSQSYESWSRGGCQRRCDGVSEELSGEPCLCVAKWGPDFHQVAPRDAACKMTTRLNVLLPEMPDIGVWRAETHSYYSANEVAAAVDMLKGSIGVDKLVPVRLRIEQRTRVAEGKTKQFPVVAVELRGGTAQQVLSGTAPTVAVTAGQQPQAVASGQHAAISAPVEPTPLRDFVADIMAAETTDDVMALFNLAKSLNVPNPDAVTAAAKARGTELKQQAEQLKSPVGHIAAAQAATTTDELTDALRNAQAAGFGKDMNDATDPVAKAFKARHMELASADAGTAAAPPLERESLWSQIVAASPFDRLPDLEADFSTRHQVLPGQATPEQLATYLAELTSGTRTQTPVNDDTSVPF